MADNKAPVPLLDLRAQFATIKDQVMPLVEQVFDQQSFILGPHVARAEEALARYLQVEHALGVSSGTDALLLSLMALEVGPGQGVVTTPFTFFATLGSIARLGAVPLLADIDPLTYNLDPDRVAELLERKDLPARPRALVPVHLFGQPARMDPLLELARHQGLAVVEDAAQAIGARYPSHRAEEPLPVGGLGTTGCFSFFPSKNLGAAGDGGLITCRDQELAQRLRSMRTHGSHPREKYRHIHLGGNFRLDALQAVVIQAKLPHLDRWSAARRANAGRYDRMFREAGLVDRELVGLPHRAWPRVESSHVFNQYVVRVKDREGLMQRLQEEQIGHAVYYPVPLHLAECFAHLGYRRGDFPRAEEAADQVLALPVYPELEPAQQERVVGVIADFYA